MSTHPQSDRSLAASYADMVFAAAFFALFAGAGETLSYLVSRYALHRLTGLSPHVSWMAPVAYAVCFAPVVAGLALARRRGRELTLPLVVGVFAFLAAFALLLPFGRIASWASMLVALGLAVQAGTWVRGREATWSRVSRRGAFALGGILGAVTAASVVTKHLREQREVANLAAARADAPNVLLIILDTVRRSYLSAYGYGRPTTPVLSRLASEGVLFRRAIATAPWTLPSHVGIFSGLLLDTTVTGGWRTPAQLPENTLAAVFRSQGYVTGGFTANLAYTSRETGLARGFVHFEGHRPSAESALLHAAYVRTALVLRLQQSGSVRDVGKAVRNFDLRTIRKPTWVHKPASVVTDGFLRWQARAGARPFFAFLNYMEAHDPDRTPAPFRQAFGAGRRLDEYDGAIAYLDREIGRLTDSLAARGVLDRTILVVASDHGEQFGEHGLVGHANSLYRPVLAVPLVMRYPPTVPAGHRVESRVSLRDLAATIADLAGLGSGLFPGTSLVARWRGDGPATSGPILAGLAQGINVENSAPNAAGALEAVYLGDLKYVRHATGLEELYDLAADSSESENLARNPDARASLVRLRAILDSALAESSGTGRAAPPQH